MTPSTNEIGRPVRSRTSAAAAKKTHDGYTIRFGMMRSCRSMNEQATSTARKGATKPASQADGITSAAPTNSSAVSSSTTGYSGEMRSPQVRQRPRNRRYDTTGCCPPDGFSVPQPGQAEPGRTIDSPLGTR